MAMVDGASGLAGRLAVLQQAAANLANVANVANVAHDVMLPYAARFSEFAGGFNGTCTQTALAVCIGAAKGKPATQEDMLWLVHDMLNRKLCGPNGASTLAAAAIEAHNVLGEGAVMVEWDYSNPFGHDWAGTLHAYAGGRPILLQVADGQALKDADTGVADESGLHYHAIAIVGKRADGAYICADGDHPQVSERYQIYTADTLTAAQPCGLLMLAALWPHVPAGWSDNPEKGILSGPDGTPVAGLFRDLILSTANWNAAKTLDYGGVTETYQTFAYEEWRSRSDENAGKLFRADIGADLEKLREVFYGVKKAMLDAGGVA